MSALRAVLDRLNDIEGTIARIETNAPAEDALATRLMLGSLEQRRDDLRNEFTEITQQELVEVPGKRGPYKKREISN